MRSHTQTRYTDEAILPRIGTPPRSFGLPIELGRPRCPATAAVMDSSSEEEVLLLLAVAEDEDEGALRKNSRTVWVHEINTTREEQGEFYILVPKLIKDERRFYIYFRMTVDCFDEILELIRQDITKQITNWRRPIPPEERLAVALRYLATGDSFSTIGHSYRIGFSTVGDIVLEVCLALWKNMKSQHMPPPTKEMWENSARRFEERWGFPNCLGSLDGKHVVIKCPDNAGSAYYDYLKQHSVVLLSIVGPEYEFLCVDVGGFGRNSDGGIFEESEMGKKFFNDDINIPDDRPLPGQTEATPYVIIADEAFALKPFMMRPFPYSQSKQDPRKEKYNTGLCRARRVVENAFGILTMKWRIFLRPIEIKEDNIKHIVSAACVLHNFLRLKNCDEKYREALLQNEPMEEMIPVQPLRLPRGANISYAIRERFVDYFNKEENLE